MSYVRLSYHGINCACVTVIDDELMEMGIESRTIRLHIVNAVATLRKEANMD